MIGHVVVAPLAAVFFAAFAGFTPARLGLRDPGARGPAGNSG